MTELVVLLTDEPIGIITQGPGGKLSFTYDEDYRVRFDAIPLSLSMPLASAQHRHKVVTNFLWNLLFERRPALEAIAVANDVSPDNPFALAGLRGEDMAGAVQMVHPDKLKSLQGRKGAPPISDARLAKALANLIRHPGQTEIEAGAAHFSLAGAQPKKTICWVGGKWLEPRGRTPSTHIIKPPMAGFHEVVENEHFCLRLAEKVGFKVAQSRAVKIGGQPNIVVERYDRVRMDRGRKLKLTEPGGSVFRVHQEDICQAMALHPRRKYQWQKGPSMADVMQLLSNSSNPTLDRERFMRACAFNYLIAGTDAHAKNFSLLLSSNGQYRLAQLYDIISALPYDTDEYDRLAMSVGGERNWQRINPKHWEKEAKDCNYPADLAVQHVLDLIEQLPDAASDVQKACRRLGLTAKLLPQLAQLIADRCKGLTAEYSGKVQVQSAGRKKQPSRMRVNRH